jgi:hypothetical protein
MQLVAIVFIIPWKALYMFRVLFTPIIRSVLKLYMQLLVQLCRHDLLYHMAAFVLYSFCLMSLYW